MMALSKELERIEKGEAGEKKQRKKLRDSGLLADGGSFEAIYEDGKPCFLKYNGGNFDLVDAVDVNGETFAPKEVQNVPYEPYGYSRVFPIPTIEELTKQIHSEFETWIDVEPIWKDVLTACTLLTYQQEKLQTVPYLFLYGDNESGKSTVLQVLARLCYRPMYGVTIPSADLYGYLEDSDGQGCILEDEVQGIDADTDKIKIYKAGYKEGAVVPRTLMTSFDRIIKYYRTFCFKACASEKIPTVKGFNERFLFIPMVEGLPLKEWADLTRDDKERMRNLRDQLLKWRMTARGSELPNVELAVKGRLKELWKPILQATSGLSIHNDLFGFVEDQKKTRLSSKQDTLEGNIVKVIVDLCTNPKDDPEKLPLPDPKATLPFHDIWRDLGLELHGKLSENRPHEMDTDEFGIVTKTRVGYRLREIISGEMKVKKERAVDPEDPEKEIWVSTKTYVFDREKLRRVAKKYGYELSTVLPSEPTSTGV